MRYALEPDLPEVLENSDILNEEEEIHYLFGLNGVFSFDEDNSVYSLVDRGENTFIVHDFHLMGRIRRCEERMDKETAIEFLKRTGYEPFMRIKIHRYVLSKEDEEFLVEAVEHLGCFTDMEEIGGKKVFYADLLKNEMIKDSEKEEEIRKQAQDILKHVNS